MKTPTTAPVRKQHQREVGARAARGRPTSRRSRRRAITTTVSPTSQSEKRVLADVVADAEVAEPRVAAGRAAATASPKSNLRDRRDPEADLDQRDRAPRASRASSASSGASRDERARRRPAGRSGSSSASRSSRRQEDDGEDGEPARERERVGADEAVLRAAELTRAEAGRRRVTAAIEPAISGRSTKRVEAARDQRRPARYQTRS